MKFSIGRCSKVLSVLAILSQTSCGSSPLQPSISNKNAPFGAAGGGTSSKSSISCSRAKGHSVYYAGSSLHLSFVCASAVSAVSPAGMPTYLSASFSGTSVLFTGTAPQAASSDSWSFTVNGYPTTGDNVVATQVITSVPTLALKNLTVDVSTTYGSVIDLGFATLSLDPLWDGSTDDVVLSSLPQTPLGGDAPSNFENLAVAATDTDVLQLRYLTSCAGATGNYLCPTVTAAAGTTAVTGGSSLHFAYGPFDQGSYLVAVRPLAIVEGAMLRLQTLKPSFTVPRATVAGNVALSVVGNTDSANAMDAQSFPYSLALNTFLSTPTNPVFGLSYVSEAGSSTNHTYFTRLSLDRSVSPLTAMPTGVTQSNSILESGASTVDSKSFRSHGLSDGSWTSLGITNYTPTSADQNVVFRHFTDSASTPVIDVSQTITAITSPDAPTEIASTDVFVDSDGQSRQGVAMISVIGGTYYVDVGKINVNGTSPATINDDASFDIAGTDIFDNSSGNKDKAVITASTYSGLPALYFAFRVASDIKAYRLSANKIAGSYSFTSYSLIDDLTVLPSPEVAYISNSFGDDQSFNIAVGANGSTQVLGMVLRETDSNTVNSGPHCYFRRIDTTMAAASRTPLLQLSSGPCRLPSLKYNTNSKRFIATFSELIGGTWQISEREITPGSTDTASATMVVVSGLSNYPVKLETSFYPEGNFVGLMYRLKNAVAPVLHGFHVSSF